MTEELTTGDTTGPHVRKQGRTCWGCEDQDSLDL